MSIITKLSRIPPLTRSYQFMPKHISELAKLNTDYNIVWHTYMDGSKAWCWYNEFIEYCLVVGVQKTIGLHEPW